MKTLLLKPAKKMKTTANTFSNTLIDLTTKYLFIYFNFGKQRFGCYGIE